MESIKICILLSASLSIGSCGQSREAARICSSDVYNYKIDTPKVAKCIKDKFSVGSKIFTLISFLEDSKFKSLSLNKNAIIPDGISKTSRRYSYQLFVDDKKHHYVAVIFYSGNNKNISYINAWGQ